MEQVVRFEAGRVIPRPLGDVVWDWAPDPDRIGIVELAAMQAGASEDLVAAARGDGVDLEAIVPRATALAWAYRYNYPQNSAGVVLADIEGDTALLLALGQDRIAVRVVGLPEQVPVGGGDTSARWRRLAVDVRQMAGEVGAANVLTLGDDEAACLDILETDTLRISRFDALRQVRVGAGAAGAAALSHKFGVVLGAALMAHSRRGPNLLPHATKRDVRLRRHRWHFLLAGSAVVLGISAADFSIHFSAQAGEARAAELERSLRPLREAQRAEDLRRKQFDELERERLAIDELRRARDFWAARLNLLQSRIAGVGDVWFERMELVRVMPQGSAVPGRGTDKAGNVLIVAVEGSALDPSPGGRRALDRLRQLFNELDTDGMHVDSERFDAGTPGLLHFGFRIEFMETIQ
jgi:hypothetical protein